MQKRHNSQWAAETTKDEPEAIIESELADCRNQKWLDFVSPEQIATKTGIYFAAGDTSVRFTPTSIEV
jgi:hypothetical protein